MRPVLALALLFPSPVLAAVRTVEADGSGQYSTISAAVAASVDGDEIRVGPGVWSESIDLGSRSITLTSTDGADATTLSGTGDTTLVSTGGAPVVEIGRAHV